jgi:hypothetical protein
VVRDWVRVVVRRSFRGGMEEVDWRWLRRDLRVEGGRVWGVWMVVVGGLLVVRLLEVVGFGLLVARGKGLSRLRREAGTSSFGEAEDIIGVMLVSEKEKYLVPRNMALYESFGSLDEVTTIGINPFSIHGITGEC